jgi:hypothetical protein
MWDRRGEYAQAFYTCRHVEWPTTKLLQHRCLAFETPTSVAMPEHTRPSRTVPSHVRTYLDLGTLAHTYIHPYIRITLFPSSHRTGGDRTRPKPRQEETTRTELGFGALSLLAVRSSLSAVYDSSSSSFLLNKVSLLASVLPWYVTRAFSLVCGCFLELFFKFSDAWLEAWVFFCRKLSLSLIGLVC